MFVHQVIENFRDFLIFCWPSLMKIMEDLWDDSPYFIDEWTQANWELLVERHILESEQTLAPYGYTQSPECRYTRKGETITHRLVCKKKGESSCRYIFLCFKSKVGEIFKIEPPFDFVGVEDIETGDRLSLPFDEVEFFVEKIN